MYDLHFHTTLSDGNDSPAKIVAAAIFGKARVIAVTDHDIVNREVGMLVQKYNYSFKKITQHKSPWIDVVE
jgi:predicted metal-dependent phosphoesterase TrpH